MSYNPTRLEKLIRGIILGFIPPTICIALYIGVFMSIYGHSNVEASAKLTKLLFPGLNWVTISYAVIYLLSAIYGYFKGWQGFISILNAIARRLGPLNEVYQVLNSDHDPLAPENRKRDQEISPAQRVKNARKKLDPQDIP